MSEVEAKVEELMDLVYAFDGKIYDGGPLDQLRAALTDLVTKAAESEDRADTLAERNAALFATIKELRETVRAQQAQRIEDADFRRQVIDAFNTNAEISRLTAELEACRRERDDAERDARELARWLFVALPRCGWGDCRDFPAWVGHREPRGLHEERLLSCEKHYQEADARNRHLPLAWAPYTLDDEARLALTAHRSRKASGEGAQKG